MGNSIPTEFRDLYKLQNFSFIFSILFLVRHGFWSLFFSITSRKSVEKENNSEINA